MVLGYASVISFVAFLFAVESVGLLKPPAPKAQPLPVVSGALSLGSGFRPDAAYSTTDRSNIPAGIKVYGSWLGSDTSTGSASTPWYAPTPTFLVMVAGYPNNPHMTLAVQTEGAQGELQTIAFTGANPQEVWTAVPVTLPNAAATKRFRIIAVDNSTAVRGWLGFSEPYTLELGQSMPVLGEAGKASMYAAAALSLISAILCGFAAWSRRLFRAAS
jgi:hypothetical protein